MTGNGHIEFLKVINYNFQAPREHAKTPILKLLSTSCMKVGSGGNLGLSRGYPKILLSLNDLSLFTSAKTTATPDTPEWTAMHVDSYL